MEATPPATKKAKVSTSERRRFVPGWKNDYPWVFCKEGRMFCRFCMDAKSQCKKAVLAGLRTVYFMAKKNLANDIFSDLKFFQVLQVYLHNLFHNAWSECCPLILGFWNAPIGSLTCDSARGSRHVTYEHSESVRGFQVSWKLFVHVLQLILTVLFFFHLCRKLWQWWLTRSLQLW